MPLEFVRCPVCKQRLGLQEYMQQVGTDVVCANPKCETNLRVASNRPLRVEQIPIESTYNVDDRPESYG